MQRWTGKVVDKTTTSSWCAVTDVRRIGGRRHTFLTLTALLLGPVLRVAFFSIQVMRELRPPSSLLAALLDFQPVILSSSGAPEDGRRGQR